MKRSSMLFLSLLLILAAAPAAYPACTTSATPNPQVLTSLVHDAQFYQNCWMWTFTGDTWYSPDGAELSGLGYVEQDISVDVPGLFEAAFEIQVVTPGHVGDRLLVELRSSTGTLLQTIATYSKNTPSGTYSYQNIANNYYGQTIKLRLQYSPGPVGTRTVFLVKQAHLWGFNV